MEYNKLSYETLVQLIKKTTSNSPFLSISSIGKSVRGRDIWCVTIQKPERTKMMNKWKISNPSKNKTSIVITASIHGHEAAGSSAILRLLDHIREKGDSLPWMDDLVIHCVVSCNPDGYVDNTRYNAAGFDLNRDFITQSQPETLSIVNLIVKEEPAVVLDLHGYVWRNDSYIGLIEPCTPPHNPSYEYDLYLKGALPLAKAMEASLVSEKDTFSSARFKSIKGTYIPYRDEESGWDDYSPFSCSMYSILQGAIGITIESPSRSEDGTTWLLIALLSALTHISKNKKQLNDTHSAFFRRGTQQNHPGQAPDYFPAYYYLSDKPLFPDQLGKLSSHLIQNGIHLYSTTKPFKSGGHTFPTGTIVVPMNQPRANLAHCLLSQGENLSDGPERVSELCAWSLPLCWGIQSLSSSVRLHKRMIPYKGNKDDTPLPFSYTASSAKRVRVGIIIDGGMFHKKAHAGLALALQEMNIPYTEHESKELASSTTLSKIDVLIYNGYEHLFYPASKVRKQYRDYVLESQAQQDACKKNLQQFMRKGGKIIGIGAGASKALTTLFELCDAETHSSGFNKNALVQMNYKRHALTKGFEAEDSGFVYRPAWFTNTGNMVVAATYGTDPESILAGYWPEYGEAKGLPAIITSRDGLLTLFGLEVCFRGHTRYFYRLLWNSIYGSHSS
ncbi:DUF2817 domain-containing protein [Rossellomorea aquimaris]|uniref:M14 family zinc carboxypeptidase n=1 Tax=Rossellomorea aquimaris TaxID=189382 RepID=UPI001CD4C23F|nr:M14 family zinc carboxypeptidase [Rossellomorea aquimaris]MCA1057187.1 DUF2817 domain-containing protein [Rossellomorea aquimaris]